MFLMPLFKIHRLKDTQFQQFRWAPHTAGASQVRPKDYQEGGVVEAQTAYVVWSMLKDSDQALRVGDILEAEGGALSICKYVGFEEARWFIPELKPEPEAGAAGPPDQAQVPAGEIPQA